MRIPKDVRGVVNDIVDDSLIISEGDITKAAYSVASELEDMEGGGHQWAHDIAHAAMVDGLKSLVRQRIRSKRVAVSGQAMPAYYTVGLSTAQWMHVDVDELEPIIQRLTKRARSYTEHAAVLIDAQQHAKDHRVSTAAEAYAAEGITVTELAS